MNVHYGDGGFDGKSISYGIAPLPKGERSPTKKASMHGKKGRTSGGKKEMMQRCITKIVRTKAKKEGAGHSIPVLWDPVVLAFDHQLSHLLLTIAFGRKFSSANSIIPDTM
mgnify:FL=1